MRACQAVAPGTHLHRSFLQLCSSSWFSTALLLRRAVKHVQDVSSALPQTPAERTMLIGSHSPNLPD